MRTSQAGVDLIKSFEGLGLDAYLDSVNVPTIGYGHVTEVKLGQTITAEQAEAFLRSDLESAESCVNGKAPDLRQSQFDACVSFVFNLGCGAFGMSTLLKCIKRSDVAAAADEFLRWNHAGGKVLDGLTRRREAERALFLQG